MKKKNNYQRIKQDNNGPVGLNTNESIYKMNRDEFSKTRSIFKKLDNKLDK